MINNETIFVRFDNWCKKCEHSEVEETRDPCNDCLDHPVNESTKKPIRFKLDERKANKKPKKNYTAPFIFPFRFPNEYKPENKD